MRFLFFSKKRTAYDILSGLVGSVVCIRDRYMYLTGGTGGPPLYENQYGHPRLRMPHVGFPIDSAPRDRWLTLMHDAMVE